MQARVHHASESSLCKREFARLSEIPILCELPLVKDKGTRLLILQPTFKYIFAYNYYCSAHAIINGGFDLDVISLSVMARGGTRLSFARDAALEISRLNATKVILQI